MANYISTILRMEGIAKTPLFTIDGNGKQSFDFEKLIPMPKELNIESGGSESVAIAYIIRECCDKTYLGRDYYTGRAIRAREHDFKRAEEEIGRNALLEKGLAYVTNIARYGYSTWYDWRIAKWGTKWNACETKIIDDSTIKFWTAWEPPIPVIKELSRIRPDREVEAIWADEDAGTYTGRTTLIAGTGETMRYDNYSQEAFEAYNDCWNDNGERLEKVDGSWRLKQEEE